MTAFESQLHERIRTRTAQVGIVGLGYVGLPLAVEFARAGFSVVGIDLDRRKVTAIRRESPTFRTFRPTMSRPWSPPAG